MKSLLIIGAGSFSPEVEEIATFLDYDDIGFVDDNPCSAYSVPVVGSTKDLQKLRERYSSAIVALGNNANRMKYHNELKELGYHIPILIHPHAFVSPKAELSCGCIVRAKAVIGCSAKLGEAVIVNMGALIDHHVVIGDGCHILIGAVIKSQAKIDPLTRIESLSLIQ